MAVIASVDGPNRRIYLHADTVGTTLHPIDIYREMRALRRTDETLRKFNLFMKMDGNIAKGGGKFTERYATLLEGTRIVPFDTNHDLTINGTLITDDGFEGISAFDRTPLSVNTAVNINYVPPQVEVIEVATGAVTPTEIRDAVWSANTSDYNTNGTFGAFMQKLLTVGKWLGLK